MEPPNELPALPEEEEEEDVHDTTMHDPEDEEDDDPTPRPGRTFRAPQSSSSARTAVPRSAEEAQDELETLPPHPSVKSPAYLRSPASTRKSDVMMIEEVGESPADAPGSGKRRRVPLSETLSSSVRLLGVISSDDGIPMPSSPLASKVRRSDSASGRSTRRTASKVYGQDSSRMADELSSDSYPQLAGIDEEMEDVGGEVEATDLIIEETTVLQEEEEDQDEERESTEEADEREAAEDVGNRRTRRPREPSPELGSQPLEAAEETEEEELEQEQEQEQEPEPEPEPEPQLEPESEPEPEAQSEPELPSEPEPEPEPEPEIQDATEAEDEVEETTLPTPPKRKRGRPSKSPPSKSPTMQKRPATKPKPAEPAKPVKPRKRIQVQPEDSNDEKEEPQPKKAKTKKRHSDQSEGDGGTIEITVQRFVNHKRRGNEDDDVDPLQNELAFANPGGESVIDVFAQVCDEVISTTLEQFQEVAGGAEDAAKKKEYRIKMRAIEAYREELKSRFLQHVRLKQKILLGGKS